MIRDDDLKWDLDPDRFVYTWNHAVDSDRYPPLMSPRESARTETEAAKVRMRLADEYPHGEDLELEGSLRNLTHQDAVSLQILGERGGKQFRLYGTIGRGRMTTIYQFPSGGFRVENRGEELLGKQLLAMVGRSPAGRLPRLVEHPEVVNRPAPRGSTAARIQHVLEGPAEMTMSMLINFDPTDYDAPAPRYRIWRTIPDDGRYLIDTGATTKVTPCSDADFVREVHHVVEK